MGFADPIVGGTALRIAAIQSPNFLEGSEGWIIRIDGSAEFNDVVIRGGETIGGSFLLYNGTPGAGNLVASISATAGTDPFGNAYGAGLNLGSQTGAHFGVDPSGNVYIVNSADLIVMKIVPGDDAFYVYSTAGAGAGTLVASISPAPGTDTYGNTRQAGIVSYNPANGYIAQLENAALTIGPGSNLTDDAQIAYIVFGSNPFLTLTSPATVSDPDPVLVLMGPGTSSNAQLQTGQVPAMIVLDDGGSSAAQIWVTGSIVRTSGLNGSAPATWQSAAGLLAANWLIGSSASASYQGLQYRFTAEDEVWLYGAIHAGAATPTTTPFVLPAGPPSYRPAATLAGIGALVSTTSADALKLVGRVNVASTGQVTLGGFTIASGDNFYFNHKFPLGNIS